MRGTSRDEQRQLLRAVCQQLQGVLGEVGQNFKQLADATIAKMDVVSRQEYESQNTALDQLAAKLDSISERLDEIEKQHRDKKHD